MLGRKNYPREYIERVQRDIEAQIAEFNDLPPVTSSFAQRLAGHLVIVMDASFVTRLRATEGKDGNALNEVRLLAQSLMYGDTVVDDSTVTWHQDAMVLGLMKGDDLELSISDVDRLQQAFFTAMLDRYAE